ncbi:MAG: sensor histidine kinase [Candidatus Limnocylindria bacterium]
MATSRRAELALALGPLLLVALTLAVLLDPDVAPAFVSEPVDLVLNATAGLVAVAVAILAWIHFREGGSAAALIRASAFGVLGLQNLAFLAVGLSGMSDALGMGLAAPGQLPLWAVVVGRGVAAGLLVVAGMTALRGWLADRVPALLILLGPSLLVAIILLLIAAGHAGLPILLDADALRQLAAEPQAPLLGAGGAALITLQALIGVGFLAAALSSYRLYRRDRREAEVFLAIGFTLAAFSQLHAAIHPGSYASLVTTGDLLRVGFYALLLVAVASEAAADVRAVRETNAELLRLQDAEVARATAEERARLAREIHDGMSQELWYAKLKQGRLAAMDDLAPEARELAGEVAAAIESALAEARQAILALRPAEGATFRLVLERYVADFADRFGIAADCVADDAADRLSPRAQAELLRIVQEALNNARKHADATRVRVEVAGADGDVRLTVADNGRGFDVAAASPAGYGLRSMRERAGIIGGTLHIDSQPQDGTRVVLELTARHGP